MRERPDSHTLQFRHDEMALGIELLNKPSELATPAQGLAWAGARDRPPITGNVKRGASPIAQLGPAPDESVLEASFSELDPEPSLQELINLRSELLSYQTRTNNRG
jgi:hypothetical protein